MMKMRAVLKGRQHGADDTERPYQGKGEKNKMGYLSSTAVYIYCSNIGCQSHDMWVNIVRNVKGSERVETDLERAYTIR